MPESVGEEAPRERPSAEGTQELLKALEERISRSKAQGMLSEALSRAGIEHVPRRSDEALSFLHGPLTQVLCERVGPAIAEHWVTALEETLSASGVQVEAPVETKIDPWLGRVIGSGVRLLQRVADGQRGVLYRAERSPDGARVAVKLVGPSHFQSPDRFAERFIHECQVASRMRHDNTLRVLEHGAADDLMYVVTEWLSGIDLERMVRSHGPLNARQAMYLAHQVCCSLSAAHSDGIVHADLSPSGIFVARKGSGQSVVKVMDYGRRRMESYNDEGYSQVGLPKGWARYLSPEQIRGDEVDARTDIYAIGAVLYEALCGERPFQDSTGIGLLIQQAEDKAQPLGSRIAARDIPTPIEALVMRCLDRDPDARFQSAAELVTLTAELSR
jgi:serine/threonine-protein kinase